MFRTSNPAFSRNDAFAPAQSWDDLQQQGRAGDFPVAESVAAPADPRVMTMQGTVNKTFFLLAICVATSLITWNFVGQGKMEWAMAATFGGAIAGFIVAMICCFAPRTAPITAPIYAAVEGLFVGGVSAMYAARFGGQMGTDASGQLKGVTLNSGLVMNAVLLTFGIMGGLLVGYSTGVIRPGRWFRNAVIAGTIGACFYGLIAMVAAMFGSFSLASVYDPSNGGAISIGFSLLMMALASGNLVLDFDLINNGVKNRAPRHMEWYGAFGLMVTLVWLYLETLRLLSKLRRE